MDALLFWILAAVTVASAVLVIGQRNPMRSVLLLIVMFMALAGLYVRWDRRSRRSSRSSFMRAPSWCSSCSSSCC
jgi:disulfide bond formation protein DsbB